ncbi:MAG TPA: 1,4-alpha-glucan branching protein GlgB [Pyrinomonadaceae bacterium]|nr:1,4-alpha-glucan branching protein GlgB [Pyrinomonadaceae bacterium]
MLGPHLPGDGLVIRALRPDAKQIEVTIGRRIHSMVRTHDAGVFEVFIPGMSVVPGYRLRIHNHEDQTITTRDAYSFLPTIGELDLHLFGEGRHEEIYKKLGAHISTVNRVKGVSFAVWAPHASGVSVVGDFNSWDGRVHQMRRFGSSGVWELFVPELGAGSLYKFEIRTQKGLPFLKADPYAQYTEVPPNTSSIVYESRYRFRDTGWIKKRSGRQHFREPLSIYEVHFGSWRRKIEEETRPFTYREMAEALAEYVSEMGFTHVEFLPLKEHPYGPSWGYQVSYYFAPSARYGTPDDFRYLIDYLHQRGIGVIMDWVPAHFPKDTWALGRFDGSALYEHLDPRRGEHPDWGTYIFNYGRNEVRNFLIANALYWLKEFHIDGLRVDAVASMLYLDYSRKKDEWVPNSFGGRENLEAIDFLKELNETTHRVCPGTMIIAEESTAWPAVSHPVYSGGLGFDFKWNMGWMHDTLKYFQTDPLFRAGNHNALTFGLLYAWSENFILPLSHDEVVHMKGSLLNKLPGTVEQKFAQLRALYGYMWAHPGKKMLFMGGEFGQWREWTETESLDWHLLDDRFHSGVQRLVRDLNRVYETNNSLWESDGDAQGFEWLDVDNALENVVAFMRGSQQTAKRIICVGNFSAVQRTGYRLALPGAGEYKLVINSDSDVYAGSGRMDADAIVSEEIAHHERAHSASLDLPPLTVMWFEVP